MAKIVWTEKSLSHLKSIYYYIAEDSKIFAQRFVTSLVKSTNKLVSQPLIGRIVPEFENHQLREIFLIL